MRYNRLGFQSNKHNTGSGAPFPSSNITITETNNTTAVTYTIVSDITHLSNLAYSITGTAVGSDFLDGATSGNIALSSGNGTLVKQIVPGNTTEPTFAVQIKASATDGAFFTGNTFQVTTISEISVSFAETGIVPRSLTGTANIGGELYTVVAPYMSGTGTGANGSITFTSLGANTSANVEVLLVAGGGGSGGRDVNTYNTDYIAGGGGGGGESLLTNVAVSSLSVGASYNYTLGIGGGGAPGSTNVDGSTNFVGGGGNNTTFLGFTVQGGSGGDGGASTTAGSYGAGGTGNGHTAGARGGAGGQSTSLVGTFVPANDGENGGSATDYTNWITSAPLTSSNATIGVAQAGAGGGGAKAIFEANAGAAGASLVTTRSTPGMGGTAVGEKQFPSNNYWVVDGRDGVGGTLQLRWPKVGETRTIAIT